MKLQGSVAAFDNFSVQLRRGGATQLVYKHAISTIAPLQWPDDLDLAGDGGEPNDLQTSYLDEARKQGSPMTLFLMNGVMLEGQVAAFDQYCLVLRRGPQGQLVYKHAISTLQQNEEARDDRALEAAEEQGA